MKYSFSILAFFCISCATIQTWSDEEKNVDYNTYTSFNMDEQCFDYNPDVSEVLLIKISNAVVQEFNSSGFTRSDNPDFIVKYVVKDESRYFFENCVEEYTDYQGGKMCIQRMEAYQVGTLAINLIDPKENRIIWHGGSLGEPWDQLRNTDNQVDKMIKSIIKEFRKDKMN